MIVNHFFYGDKFRIFFRFFMCIFAQEMSKRRKHKSFTCSVILYFPIYLNTLFRVLSDELGLHCGAVQFELPNQSSPHFCVDALFLFPGRSSPCVCVESEEDGQGDGSERTPPLMCVKKRSRIKVATGTIFRDEGREILLLCLVFCALKYCRYC